VATRRIVNVEKSIGKQLWGGKDKSECKRRRTVAGLRRRSMFGDEPEITVKEHTIPHTRKGGNLKKKRGVAKEEKKGYWGKKGKDEPKLQLELKTDQVERNTFRILTRRAHCRM